MSAQNLPYINDNAAAVDLIMNGTNIWTHNSSPTISTFKYLYLHEYAALPINIQFDERGVKNSGYVVLGRRG